MPEDNVCCVAMFAAGARAKRPEHHTNEEGEHGQQHPAIGKFAENVIVDIHHSHPYREASGVKVEKSTKVPSICMYAMRASISVIPS